jgi:hypothetical protein
LGDYSKISQTQPEKWEGLAHLIASHIVGLGHGFLFNRPVERSQQDTQLMLSFDIFYILGRMIEDLFFLIVINLCNPGEIIANFHTESSLFAVFFYLG